MLENKSIREVQRELVSRASEPQKLIPEKLRAVTETHSELKFMVEEGVLKEIEELRALLSQKLPQATIKEVLAYAVTHTVKALKPKAPKTQVAETKNTEAKPVLKATAQTTSPPTLAPVHLPKRNIPAEIKRQVWHRDQGQCTFTVQGKRCCSKYGLEFDHRIPFAMGGETTAENLRLRCRTHNQLAAVVSFGSTKMAQFIPKLRG